jgi:hypothetical protein
MEISAYVVFFFSAFACGVFQTNQSKLIGSG